ncbi:MAG: hypothetical protein H0T79_13735 [Deltaproteobacteria bacterium]|nr:hypothetical protein [Deltaproteobacteria bacterium]
MFKAGVSAAVILISLTACGVGDDAGTEPDPNGRLCASSFKLSGAVTNRPPIPDNDGDGQPDIGGCWPSGLWTFTATADGGDCSPAPEPLAKYEVNAEYKCLPAGKDCGPTATDETRGEYAFEITYRTDTTIRTHIKIGSGGGGLCEGIFELFDTSGKEVWNLHPTLQADNTLGGTGEFSRFSTDQWSE